MSNLIIGSVLEDWKNEPKHTDTDLRYVTMIGLISLLDTLNTNEEVIEALHTTHFKFLEQVDDELQKILDVYFVNAFNKFFPQIIPQERATYNSLLAAIKDGTLPDYRYPYTRLIILSALESAIGDKNQVLLKIGKIHKDQRARLPESARAEADGYLSNFFTFNMVAE